MSESGRDVDEDDVVGGGQDSVGQGFADAGAGELGDLVVEALQVLDVDA